MRLQSTPGVGLEVSGIGVGVLTWALPATGVELATWVAIVLTVVAVATVLSGILLEFRARRATPSTEPGSTFARLDGVTGFFARGNYSNAEVLVDAKASSDLAFEDNLHKPHERAAK